MATTSSSSASAAYTQANRAFRFAAGGAKDLLIVQSFQVDEGLSRPYRVTVDLLSEDDAKVKPASLVRSPATLTLDLVGSGERTIHGIINRFARVGKEERFTRYRAEIVPTLWFLSQTRDCCIYQTLSVPDIVEKVLKANGVKDVQLKLLGNHPVREYVVQYRESHLDFVSRLLEEEGIFYFFQHTADKHVLVLADDASFIKPCPGLKTVKMAAAVDDRFGENVLFELSHELTVHPGEMAFEGFDYEKPTAKLGVSVPSSGKGVVFDYPGTYTKFDEGERLARLRMEEIEATAQTAHGAGNVRAFTAGAKFDLGDHFAKDANQGWQLVRVMHRGRVRGLRAGEVPGEEYGNEFVAIPAKVVFRPPRVTPRPIIPGSQTAIVVGKSGEEIWVDKFGRVKVKFHWDHAGPRDENASCWVRVATTWAGKQWGAIQIPRIGQEVIVDFLDGDPDRPIVTGSVYNGDNMPPYALPANGTQSGVKSRSAKGGGAANFNEFRFEDKKGSEQVFLHAEKNQDVEVENDETHWVGHDQALTVDHDRTKHVKNDETTTVDKNRTESVGENETITIGKNRSENVGENESVTVGKNRVITVGESNEHSVGKDHLLTVAGSRTTDIGKDDELTVDGARKAKVTKDDTLGAMNVSVNADKSITVKANTEIKLECGAAKLILKTDGTITLEGVQVSVKGQAKLELEGAAMAALKSSGILQVQGSMVKIN